MKINFSKAQYQRLLEMVYLGNWVINAHEVPGEGTGEYKKYDDLLWYIWSFAKDFDVKNLVDQEGNKAYPSGYIENKMLEYVSEYEDNFFRDELADKMATKEMLEIHGVEKIGKMSREEHFTLHGRLMDTWSDEFIEHGLENLRRK